MIYVGRPAPLYFVGDSHALAFADRLYRLRDSERRLVSARCGYINGLHARDTSTAEGLAAPFAAVLSAFGLLIEDEGIVEAFHRSQRPHWGRVAAADGRERAQPPIVLSCGTLDCVRIIAESGIALDAAPFEATFAPLERALTYLRALGFDRVAVLSVPPFPISDAEFARYFFVRCEAAVRRRAIAFANEGLASVCERTGFAFVDRNDDLGDAGIARDELFVDGIHIGEAAASATVARVLAALPARGEELAQAFDG